MIGSLSHNSAVMGNHNVDAGVEAFAFVRSHCISAAPDALPGYARFALIQNILRLRNATKVCNAVISAITVNVVNNTWLLTVIQKPSNAMRSVMGILVRYFYIAAMMIKTARDGSSFSPSTSNLPRQIARLRIVIQDIADGIWNNFRVHFVPHYVVDRGARTAILVPHFNHKDRDGTNIRER